MPATKDKAPAKPASKMKAALTRKREAPNPTEKEEPQVARCPTCGQPLPSMMEAPTAMPLPTKVPGWMMGQGE